MHPVDRRQFLAAALSACGLSATGFAHRVTLAAQGSATGPRRIDVHHHFAPPAWVLCEIGCGRVSRAANPFCAASPRQADDPSENAQSVGSIVSYGRFRVAHIGDLTWNTELDLMCPNNRLGTVDLFLVSHHGQAISNSPALVHALRPRVATMNNGTRKGGQPDAMKVMHSSPGLEDLWQLHFSQLSGQEYTVPGLFIANVADDQGRRERRRQLHRHQRSQRLPQNLHTLKPPSAVRRLLTVVA